ncbi:BMC domain-containing protein [Schinkia azotoformans]|uniref:Microcompartments protein n=1 Tax=Schinkia azotoformans LMG 9581 TaxID=1131731 RepID=K6D892_SCHAZ|nr:BMC domain-containing protein [Schinkia azotoformans]EKN64479.1 microcompartments protein [Schinkia azotoformans LMG 9581]MEC1640165.1 BMC domain-containing protein [Schinkia azotoformans]MEC1722509.1 BMC domain-containing protein [Schinkia azotoformans]MEC1945528.1 BMC domain-containing protein [Schinkia azotoformans]MED4415481.1 BMC domain-containing protein [Schinkia azotoformans]
MQALGMIETVGLAAAIEAADTAVKSANVALVGYELTKGGGMVTVKFEGDVGAVKAAVEAGVIAAERIGKVFSKHIIPRPGNGVDKVVYSNETVGQGNPYKEHKPNTVEHSTSLGLAEVKGVPSLEDTASDFNAEVPEEALLTDKQIMEENQSFLEDAGEADEERNGLIEVCNICNDPKCPRRKGDLKSTCIHYKKLRRNAQ